MGPTYSWSSLDRDLLECDGIFPFEFHVGERCREGDCIASVGARWEADGNDFFKLWQLI